MAKLSTKDRDELDKGSFAFPKQRKEPLENASHVRNAISRFKQVKDVTDGERDSAWKRIVAAAKNFDVEVNEKSWRDVGKWAARSKAMVTEATRLSPLGPTGTPAR